MASEVANYAFCAKARHLEDALGTEGPATADEKRAAGSLGRARATCRGREDGLSGARRVRRAHVGQTPLCAGRTIVGRSVSDA